jgi:hypothetical protein
VPARNISLEGNRRLVFSSVAAGADHAVQAPFATLVPAYDASEREEAEVAMKVLIGLGCVEFCCVGPEAELLHDAFDEIIEAEGALDVVTTWMEDPSEASEYFLRAAGGGQANLVALVLSHPELQAKLKERC